MSALQPIVLIGAGRSGTKFLRDLMHSHASIQRIPYDVNYVWRTGNESHPDDEIPPDRLSTRSMRSIRRQLQSLGDKGSARPDARFLVEKSVSNTLRVDLVDAVLPEARYVEVVRNGYAVTESALRNWRAPADRSYLLGKLRYFPWTNYRYAAWYLASQFRRRSTVPVWGPRYRGIDDDVRALPLATVCARQWRRCVERSEHQLSSLDPERVLRLRYEDLVGERHDECLRDLAAFLDVDPKPLQVEWDRTAVVGNDEKWRSGLDDEELNLISSEFDEMPIELRPVVA